MNKYWKIILGGIVLAHLFLMINLKFTAWPEMLLWPSLISRGLLPYVNIAIAHTPNLPVDLAFFYRIFGTGIIQLKVYTWLLILLTDFIVYFVVKKIWNQKIALAALVSYVLWQLFFEGNGLWFDLAFAPLAVLTFYFVKSRKFFWVGVFWVIMFFTKQTAVWFLLPILFSIKINKKFVFGVLLTSLIWVVGFWVWGIFPSFYKWAINFGIFVLPKAQGQVQLPNFKNLVVSVFPFLIFIPLFLKTRKKNIDLFFWCVAGSLGAYPRFEYFHFQPAIPFLAISTALVITEIKNLKGFLRIFIILYLLGTSYLFFGFFIRNWREGTRFYEQDVTDVVSYITKNTREGEKIFVMNWWDSVYALSNRLPATNPWVPQLSWYQEIQAVQDKEISDLKTSKPSVIILYPYSESGLSVYIPQKLYNYVIANYKLKEKVDGIEVLIPR